MQTIIALPSIASHRFPTLLKVRNEIRGDERDALRITHERFQGRPLRFQLLLARQLFAFGNLFKFIVQLRQRRRIQSELGNPALIIDRHRRLIRHRALNVIDADVITEHRPRVGVGLLDRRTGEANE
jgi:hypothetical protein